MSTDPKWYTITIVEHHVHPSQRERQADPTPPVDVLACTVLPNMAATILRGIADEIAPKKPVMRGVPSLPSED